MKRKITGASFIMTLLLSTVAGVMFVNLAEANPSPETNFPSEPILTPPTIVVHSPVPNQNYDSTDVWLNFTIIKPEGWTTLPKANFTNNPAADGYWGYDADGNPLYVISGNVTSVCYVVDGGERQNISVHDLSYFVDAFPTRTLNFSTKLMLPKGAHSVVVSLEADSYYLIMGRIWPVSYLSIRVNESSEMVNFTVLQEPFPTALVVASITSVAIIGAGVLVYFRKRFHARIDKHSETEQSSA